MNTGIEIRSRMPCGSGSDAMRRRAPNPVNGVSDIDRDGVGRKGHTPIGTYRYVHGRGFSIGGLKDNRKGDNDRTKCGV